jgi:CheY-like chemotaxis protein
MTPRILVIDDDLAVRETLAQVLPERSYDVVLAPTGAQWLALFERRADGSRHH